MGYRYIGAKTKIIQEILSKSAEIVGPGAQVVDLMCGTGAVAAAFRQLGHRVTANDVMTYSFHHARVALLFSSAPIFAGAQSFIDEFSKRRATDLFPLPSYPRMLQALSAVSPMKGYFWKEFSPAGNPKNRKPPRNYFTPDNAKKIDAVRHWIRSLHRTGDITDLEHSLLLHDLIMAANDVAIIAGTYGHYLSQTVSRAKVPLQLTPTPLILRDDEGQHRVLQGYAESVASVISCDLCYIDPPYMKRQYAANYHILETLAREDEPEAVGVSGLRPWRDQYSNFCTKTKVRESFRQILTNMTCSNFLISYSEDGLLTLRNLTHLFKDYGDVKVNKFSNKRFCSNNSKRDSRLTEYLIYLRIR